MLLLLEYLKLGKLGRGGNSGANGSRGSGGGVKGNLVGNQRGNIDDNNLLVDKGSLNSIFTFIDFFKNEVNVLRQEREILLTTFKLFRLQIFE